MPKIQLYIYLKIEFHWYLKIMFSKLVAKAILFEKTADFWSPDFTRICSAGYKQPTVIFNRQFFAAWVKHGLMVPKDT